MNKQTREKLASRVAQINEELEQVKKERDEALEKLADMRRRQRAENILIEARESGDDLPDNLRPMSLDDFFAKRAQLEEKQEDELEKIASLVEMSESGYGIETVPSIPDDETDPGDFEGFLRKHT